MYDRRSFIQVIELANNGFGVPVVASFAAARPGALAEQLLLADDGYPGTGQQNTVINRRNGHADPMTVFLKLVPALHTRQIKASAGQKIMQLFTPTG